MSFRRVGWVAAIALATLLEISCGEVYRPVVIPTSTTPPNPANFHAVFGISANAPFNPGTALQIDVSGDTDIGVANMGVNPTHAATFPNHSRVFVASAGSLFTGDTDVVTAFFPAAASSSATGLGTVTTFTLPNVGVNQTSGILAISENGSLVTMTLSAPLINAQAGTLIVVSGVVIPGKNIANPTGYDGSFPISSVNGTTIQYVNSITGLTPTSGGSATVPIPLFCSYLPDFVTTSQSSAVYVANFGEENGAHCNLNSTDSVAVLDLTRSVVGNIAYLPPGAHPVAMVETPNSQNLYVVNQGNNTVVDLAPTDLSTIATISVGSTPVWAVARPDSQRVYVVTEGDGQLYTIDTATNAQIPGSPQPVGGAVHPGANFVLYDQSRNRLYVTNPTAGSVYVFDATADPPAPLGNVMGIGISQPPPCTVATCTPAMPVSVAALPDGSRFYVASYATAASGIPCPDPTQTAPGCVIPQVTVFDAASLTVKTTVFPLLPPAATGTGTTAPFALSSVQFCVPVTPYTPASARFRMSAAAAADSSRVYASMCDGGAVAIINATTSTIATGGNNTPDTLVTDLAAPFGSGVAQSNGQPLPQNPVFLLTGQ